MNDLKNTILRVIQRGNTEGLVERVSTIYLAGGLLKDDYNEIMALLMPTETTPETEPVE